MAGTAATATIDASKWFYHWMALTCLAVAVIGFVPTFFAPLMQGAFEFPPIFYLHGVLFFAWTLFFCTQTWLTATGRIRAHREWGLMGVALATAMAFSVISVIVVRLNQVPPILLGPGSASFSWAQIATLTYFEACVVAALANTRRPERHRRFMLLATISILNAPIGRLIFVLFPPSAGGPPGPAPFYLSQGPPVIAALLIVAAMVFDWRTRGRVSLIYAIGLPLYLATSLSFDHVAFTPAWLAVADWLREIGG